MPGFAETAVILLAAGEGRRFGGHKLEAELGGKMLGLHAAETLAAMGFGQAIAVCNADNIMLNGELERLGFETVPNPDPANGQSSSLALGLAVAANGPCRAAVIALADMPYITTEHLAGLMSAFADSRDMPVCSTDGCTRMPPAIFPRGSWLQASDIRGDRGALDLLRNALCIQAASKVLKDIDTPEDID
ncbi:MAG: nucleotidyltransferase family protein [Sphingorhabdus sp.]